MRSPHWFRVVLSLGLTAVLCQGAALAANPPASSGAATASTPPNSTTQAAIEALTKANAAVVGVNVKAAEGARSAETLGAQRSGSGVVIGVNGLILTIGYLMLEADQVSITTQDNKVLPARAVAYDLATGFGLLQPLLPLRVAPVKLGSYGDIQEAEPLMASTGGGDGDVAMTQLVSKRKFSGYWEYHIEQAIFTSPPINNHSGAPLFNRKGELLGIGSLFVMDATGQNVRLPGNMFVPVDLLKPILSELQETGSTAASKRPWLGVTSAEQAGRVQIVRVNKESPAQAAGIRPGDFVLAVDGATVASLEAFYKAVWNRAAPEAEVKLTVLRGADVKTITLKPVDRQSTMRRPSGI
jgi:serine protease Do